MDIALVLAKPTTQADTSDAELVRRHQVKVDARIEEIDKSLGELQTRRIMLRQKSQDVELRLAAAVAKLALELVPILPDRTLDYTTWKREREDTMNMQNLLEAEHRILLRERSALAQQITVEAFAAAPLRRVPTEVMFEIFMAAKPPEIPILGQGMGSFLSLVCSKWRAIACQHPELWSSFSLPLFGGKTTELVKTHLERSRWAPLMVEVDARHRMEGSSTGEAEIALLAAHATRIFRLGFITEGDFRSQHILPSLQPLRGNLPRLEILEFSGNWRPLSDEFEFTPALHTLKLNKGMTLTEGEHKLDRTKIRYLHSHMTNGRFLAPYTDLTSWTCHAELHYTAYSTPPSFPTPVPTPCLTTWKILFDLPPPGSMKVEGGGDRYTTYLFHGMDTPALRELDVLALIYPTKLRDFLARCRCNLTTLVLRSCVMRVTELLNILEYTPNLATLTVVGGNATIVTNRLFHFLTVHSDQPAALPNLSSLTVDGSFVFDNTAVLDMLGTRTAPAAARSNGTYVCLNDVYISLQDRVAEADVVERFRTLEGITVVLKCLNNKNKNSLYRVI
ncbi:hypothetical protein C8R44DRAFT_972729 [Mycena epipterygia]|nr:hypothetical protein C8R44DRAFT_972729 [Mycena epipterygia]